MMDEELLQKASDERKDARSLMEQGIRRAFQYVVYLDQGRGENEDQGRTERVVRFEQDNQSSLDGSIVWAKLVELGKAFGTDECGAKALLHNLSQSDYGRPLNELRDLFWRQVIWNLLYGLAVCVDDGASHIQATVKIVLPEAALEEFKKLAAEAGVTVWVTPIS